MTKKDMLPIGIEFCKNGIKVSQLSSTEKGLGLVGWHFQAIPEGIESGSAKWQRWAIEAMKEILKSENFKGRKVVSSITAREIFIDHLKIPQAELKNCEKYILEKTKNKLTFAQSDVLLKYVLADNQSECTRDVDAVIMAADKVKVERYLAILESAKVEIESLCDWPSALANSFVNFFARRESDKDKIVFIANICSDTCGFVIAKYNVPIFARYLDMGLANPQSSQHIIDELKACVRYFDASFANMQIERIIIMCRNKTVKQDFTDKLASMAKEMNILTQMGDVCEAVTGCDDASVQKLPSWVDMSIPFGLSCCN